MLRITAFAPLAILTALGVAPLAAQAQAPTDAMSYSQPQTGNVVGGGGATIDGGGDDMVITYDRSGAGGGASLVQVGRLATFAGTDGDGPLWNYAAAEASGGGREAWLIGGEDNAQVVYSDPANLRQR